MSDNERKRPDDATLDPADWEAARALGRRMADDTIVWLRDLTGRPVWRPVPPEVRAFFGSPAPREGIGAEAAYAAFREKVLPYPFGNIHPRGWGWVNGTGTPLGVLSEMLAASMNSNVWCPNQSAALVEKQVLAWCAEMLGYPTAAGGLLVSGGSMANLVGLAVARASAVPGDVDEEGIAATGQPLAFYTSSEGHNSIDKAAALLGIGRRQVRRIPVDAEFRIDVEALRHCLAQDRADGVLPVAVVGTAGTVNTGATDDLEALADLCAAERLWFHVDGAFGALAALVPSLRPRLRGMERADSLAFDLHKWMYMPIEVGCVLVRDPELQRRTFSVPGAYLTRLAGGVASGDEPFFSEMGPQLTRGFRALKVWMSILEHGLDRYAGQIERNVAQAAWLAERIGRAPELELMAPAPLCVVVFRYRGGGSVAGEALDRINERIVIRLQESGEAVPSHTRIRGRFGIRVALTNHRTRLEDLEFLAARVVAHGREIEAGG